MTPSVRRKQALPRTSGKNTMLSKSAVGRPSRRSSAWANGLCSRAKRKTDRRSLRIRNRTTALQSPQSPSNSNTGTGGLPEPPPESSPGSLINYTIEPRPPSTQRPRFQPLPPASPPIFRSFSLTSCNHYGYKLLYVILAHTTYCFFLGGHGRRGRLGDSSGLPADQETSASSAAAGSDSSSSAGRRNTVMEPGRLRVEGRTGSSRGQDPIRSLFGCAPATRFRLPRRQTTPARCGNVAAHAALLGGTSCRPRPDPLRISETPARFTARGGTVFSICNHSGYKPDSADVRIGWWWRVAPHRQTRSGGV